MNQSESIMIGTVGASANEIYEAVLSLSRSIAGRTDLEALLSGVRESLRRIVSFDHLGLILHDPDSGAMQGHILNEPGNPVITSLRMPVEADPAGWVWLNQQPLILSSLDAETRWPEFISRSRAEFGLSTLILVPLTAGENRLGAFGFSSVAPYEPSPAEMEFLERVATEFAVAVEGFLARQAAVRERDRLRTLFDITNALGFEAGAGRVVFRYRRAALEADPARLLNADGIELGERPAGSLRAAFHRAPVHRCAEGPLRSCRACRRPRCSQPGSQ